MNNFPQKPGPYVVTRATPKPFVEFWVRGEPVPWSVYTKRGGRRIILPNGDHSWEGEPVVHLAMKAWQTQIQAAAIEAMEGRAPLTCMTRVTVRCYRSLPEWAPKTEPAREKWIRKHLCMKPDALNYAKAAEDALEGIIVVNDSQDVEVVASKGYSFGEPYTIIKVETLE